MREAWVQPGLGLENVRWTDPRRKIRELPFGLVIPEDRDKKLSEKLRRFREAGPDQIRIVWDFDGTITQKTIGSPDHTILGTARSFLPEEERLKQEKVSKENSKLEKDGKLPEEEARAWWDVPLSSFVKYKLSLPEIMERFYAWAEPRPEVIDTLKRAERLGMPSVIVSAGLEDVIEKWCKKFEVNPTAIVSTKLKLGKAEEIIGWDEESMVYLLNKQEKAAEELAHPRSDRPFTIVIGDNIDDAKVVGGEENVLRIRMKDLQKEEAPEVRDEFRRNTFTKFDMLIESGSFKAVHELLNYMATPHSSETTSQPRRGQ